MDFCLFFFFPPFSASLLIPLSMPGVDCAPSWPVMLSSELADDSDEARVAVDFFFFSPSVALASIELEAEEESDHASRETAAPFVVFVEPVALVVPVALVEPTAIVVCAAVFGAVAADVDWFADLSPAVVVCAPVLVFGAVTTDVGLFARDVAVNLFKDPSPAVSSSDPESTMNSGVSASFFLRVVVVVRVEEVGTSAAN